MQENKMNSKEEKKDPKKLLELYQRGEDLVMVVKNLDEERRQQAIQMMVDFCIKQENDSDGEDSPDDSGDRPEEEGNGLRMDMKRYICDYLGDKSVTRPTYPNPVLLTLEDFVGKGEWEGTATELLNLIPGDFKTPGFLTKYLNLRAREMFDQYELLYQSVRINEGHYIYLKHASNLEREMIRDLEKAFHLVIAAFKLQGGEKRN